MNSNLLRKWRYIYVKNGINISGIGEKSAHAFSTFKNKIRTDNVNDCLNDIIKNMKKYNRINNSRCHYMPIINYLLL
jgi:hypothetical protein